MESRDLAASSAARVGGKSKMALSCLSCVAASNLILLITGGLSLPFYFSYFGSEAVTRFSLLLCLHSVLLAAIPRVLVSIIVPSGAL